ncbi:hypothetical protein [Psychrobacter vallis]|uniref:hypothetical protein n=1 Tax=Psychrobacter vallis TaxID=248451 RepID=UPI00191A69C3|nr:hypothetical protein [Psychrobacter vallis]
MLDKALITIKLKLIFLPFLGLSLLTAVVYAVVRWTFDIHLDIWPFNDTIWDLIIPTILSVMVVLIGMRKRVRLLRFKLFEEKSFNVCSFVMIMSLFPALSVSQAYLSKASYHVIDINNVDEVRQYPKQKYFRIADFDINKPAAEVHMTTELSGKYQSHILAYLYVATPFVNAKNIWLAKSFRIEIDNNITEAAKRRQLNRFIEESEHEYKVFDASSIAYFEYIKNSDVKRGYLQATKLLPQPHESEAYMLLGKQGTLSEDANAELLKFIRFFLIGMAICLAMILRVEVDKKP